jgi:endonuclease/exonuclease/phosphatase family metal-dependent hydrolase
MPRAALAALLLLAACGGGSSGSSAQPDLTVAQLNFLHGTSGGCNQTANCRLVERADLLFEWIAGAGCPDLVTLQEIWSGSLPLLRERAATACPYAYDVQIATDRPGPDESAILSRYPILSIASQGLFPGFRRVVHARIDHPLGAIDVYTTHLASSADGAAVPCNGPSPCPATCIDAGARTRRECQAVQMAQYVESTHTGDAPAVLSGDFNAEPGSFVYQQFVGRGWDDVYLAAGNPECDPDSGVGCTSGREDQALVELESPASNEGERIDFIFLLPAAPGFRCRAALDPADDRDGDGTATRHFTDDPNPFAAACGAAPLPICWPSDHEGVELDLNCD